MFIKLDQLNRFWTNVKSYITTTLTGYVAKVEGKDLSQNDLTNALKTNYDTAYTHSQSVHAPSGAEANVIETVKVNGVAQPVTSKSVDIAVPVLEVATNDQIDALFTA